MIITLRKILFLVLALPATGLIAQQDPMFSMYMFDKLLVNPGFTGSSDWAVATLKHRDQFVGMHGRPTTQTFNFHAPVSKRKLGLGIKIIQDRIAVQSNLNAALLVAYHLRIGGGKLSLGIEGGVFNKRTEYQKLILATAGDDLIPAASTTSLTPDASTGFYYQKKQFYTGLSAYHLLDEAMPQNTGGGVSHTHLYFLLGNVFDLGRLWSLEPSMLLKYHAAGVWQVDANLMAYFNDRVGVGVQYRTSDAVSGILRVHITNGIRIAYAYDYTISELSNAVKGSHEVVLSFGLKLLPPAQQKEIHPRYYF